MVIHVNFMTCKGISVENFTIIHRGFPYQNLGTELIGKWWIDCETSWGTIQAAMITSNGLSILFVWLGQDGLSITEPSI